MGHGHRLRWNDRLRITFQTPTVQRLTLRRAAKLLSPKLATYDIMNRRAYATALAVRTWRNGRRGGHVAAPSTNGVFPRRSPSINGYFGKEPPSTNGGFGSGRR